MQEETWDEIIQPKKKLLDLKFGELWRYRDLVMLFVRRDIVSQYKQTILGPIWLIIQPLLTTFMFVIVFSHIAAMSTDGIPESLFYLGNVVCWGYFSQCLTKTSATFISNANIFGKVYFPRLSVPISVVISNLIMFAIQFGLFLVLYFIFAYKSWGVDIRPNYAILLLPLLLLIMALLGLGSGIIISALTTKYRDLQYLVAFGVQLLMYGSPVIFPLNFIKPASTFYWVLMANPLTPIMETFRYGFIGRGMFNPMHLLYSFVFAVLIFFLGAILFNRVERTFMDTV